MESHRWVKTSLRLAPSAIISSVRLSAVRSDSACIQSSRSAPVLSVLKIPPNPIPCPAPCVDAAHNHGNIFVKRGEWVHDKSETQKTSKLSSPLSPACNFA